MDQENKGAHEERTQPRRTSKTCWWILFILIILGIAAVLIFPYTGIYNVAATADHTPFGEWFLDTMMVHSVRAAAEEVQTPNNLYSQSNLQRGYQMYTEMCVICHGAPGVERSEIGKGITPQPPDLSEAAGEWTAGQVQWIIDHGIKLAGMPAFGPTHSEDKLWAVTAFVKRLPEMSAEAYRNFSLSPSSGGGEGGHESESSSEE